jgi:hypothetical protein
VLLLLWLFVVIEIPSPPAGSAVLFVMVALAMSTVPLVA